MSDHELLELAAKAAGMARLSVHWNPLTDDGDALRLMATLNINVYYRENINGAFVIADRKGEFCPESLDGPHEWDATRRAIVRAAAEIGKAMP
jgi:hypothetical protein